MTLCRFCPVSSAVSFILAVAQNLGLDLKEIGLNSGGTTHAPQQRCKAGHQLALHGSSGVVICDDIRFECLILFVLPERQRRFRQSIHTPCEQPPNPGGWCSLVMMSTPATPNHDLWRVHDITYNSHVLHSTQGLNRREGLITGRNP